MTDLLRSATRIVTKQVVDKGEVRLVPRNFMLTDLLVSNSGGGSVTVLARDDLGRVHVVASIPGGMTWSHAFMGGFVFWREAELFAVKETDMGVVNVTVGFVRMGTSSHYSIWRVE